MKMNNNMIRSGFDYDEEFNKKWKAYDMLYEFESTLYDYQLADFRRVMDAVNAGNSETLKIYYDIGYKQGYADGKEGIMISEKKKG